MTLVLMFSLGAASVMALSVGTVILGLQWFTTYPFRLGWRALPSRWEAASQR